MTERIAPIVKRACRDAAASVRVRVVCPTYVPAVPFARLGTSDAAGLHGFIPFAPDFYEVSFNNGDNPGTVHWMAGGGTPAAVRRHVLSDASNEVKGLPERAGALMCRGSRVLIYRWRGRAGGPYSGHVLATTASRGEALFASVHGWRHRDATVAILVSMLGPASGTRCR